MSVLVKICGLTNEADAEFAVRCGADYLGFVLYPKSARYVAPASLRRITASLPPGVRTVGVFVNSSSDEVLEVMDSCGLDIAQLHGGEPPSVAHALGPERVWKAFSLTRSQDLVAAQAFPAAVVVVDTMEPGRPGGTGKLGNWALAANLAAQRPMFLAGGLTPDNVAEAVARVKPLGVDVSSGVEIAPGRKDHDRLQRFISQARSAGRSVRSD